MRLGVESQIQMSEAITESGGRGSSWRQIPKNSWAAYCGPKRDDAGDSALVARLISCQALVFVLASAVKEDWGHRLVIA